jgi:chromosome segregation ATPase
MSSAEQVRVREGVWRTRGGDHVEVRARQDRVQTQFQWVGSIFGVAHRWRDDGRKSADVDHHCDLVAYVGSLPETEEQAGETLQETLGQALEQAYIADLKKALDAVTADRDRLQQQLEAMATANETLRRHFAWMTADRDILHAELKDANELLQNERLEAQAAHAGRKRAEENLEAMTTDRDQSARGLLRVTADRDGLLQTVAQLQQQLETMTADRDSLEQQLATMTYERDNLAQRLWTKPSEEALQKRVAKQNIEINTLEDRLQDMTDDRETLRRQFEAMTADWDGLQAELAIAIESLQNERLEAQQAHAGRKRAEENLEAMTAHCDRLAAEINTAERESGKTADEAAHQEGFDNGQSWAFQVMYTWVQPLAGASRDESPGLIRALPGLIRRLAEREGVVI